MPTHGPRLIDRLYLFTYWRARRRDALNAASGHLLVDRASPRPPADRPRRAEDPRA